MRKEVNVIVIINMVANHSTQPLLGATLIINHHTVDIDKIRLRVQRYKAVSGP